MDTLGVRDLEYMRCIGTSRATARATGGARGVSRERSVSGECAITPRRCGVGTMRVMEHAFVTPRRAERGLGGRQCRKKAYRTSRVCCDAVSGVVKRHRVVHGAKDAAWKPLASALCARFQGAFGRAPWTTSSFARCKCTRVLFMPLRPLAGSQ